MTAPCSIATPAPPPHPWRSGIALLILTGVLMLLAAYPSGAFPRTVVVTALTLTAAGLVLALWTWLGSRSSGAVAPPLRGPTVPECIALGALLTALTLIPLPLDFAGREGSARQTWNRAADEMLLTAESMDWIPAETRGYALTRNRAGTARWALMMFGAGAAALLAAQLTPVMRLILLRLLLLLGVVIATAGLASMGRFPQGDTLWWRYPVDHGLPGPVACFRNRNHFAAFLAMLVPVALALFAGDLRRRRIIATVADLAAFAVLAAAILLSLSRGAILATGVGLLATVILLFRYRQYRLGGTLATLAALSLAIVLMAPHAGLRERLATFRQIEEDDSFQTRVAAWHDAAAIVRAYPLVGAGANGFRLVYPQHRTTSQSAQMTHAENEYIQGLVDGGALGLLFALAFAVVFWRAAIRPALRPPPIPGAATAPDPAAFTLPLAALAAGVTVAANAVVDFPLHIPLYAIPAAMILGLLLPPPETAPPPRRPGRPLAPPILLFALTLAVALPWARHLQSDGTRWLWNAPLPALARAIAWTPTSAPAWYRLGDHISAYQTPEARLFAGQCYTRATQLDPLNYRLWDRIGYARLELGDRAGARAAFMEVKALRDWMWVPDLDAEETSP